MTILYATVVAQKWHISPLTIDKEHHYTVILFIDVKYGNFHKLAPLIAARQ